jgi:hypothetical protein
MNVTTEYLSQVQLMLWNSISLLNTRLQTRLDLSTYQIQYLNQSHLQDPRHKNSPWNAAHAYELHIQFALSSSAAHATELFNNCGWSRSRFLTASRTPLLTLYETTTMSLSAMQGHRPTGLDSDANRCIRSPTNNQV